MNNSKNNTQRSSNITTETSSSRVELRHGDLPIWKTLAKFGMAVTSLPAVGDVVVSSNTAAGSVVEKAVPAESVAAQAKTELTEAMELAKKGHSNTLYTTWEQVDLPDGRYGHPFVVTTGVDKDTNTVLFYLPTNKMPDIEKLSASSIVDEAKELELGNLKKPLVTAPVTIEGNQFYANIVFPEQTTPTIQGVPELGGGESFPVFITVTKSN